jgi:hypothetical protein
MRLLLSLFALSVLTLGVSVWPACSSHAVGVSPLGPATGGTRVECGTPSRLYLRRFEDGSARLECGDRILVRVSVPR